MADQTTITPIVAPVPTKPTGGSERAGEAATASDTTIATPTTAAASSGQERPDVTSAPVSLAPAPTTPERKAEKVEIEWAELWPDGRVRPLHPNYAVIGEPSRTTRYARRGTKWVRRTVTYSEWQEWAP